jgi:hypothetical protein
MKQFVSIAMIAFAVTTGCGTASNLPAMEQRVSIKVECRNEMNVRSQVVQLLRSPKAKDLTLTPDGGFIEIEVVFVVSSNSDRQKIDQLEDELKRIPGVTFVEVRRPTREVRQTLY